jgi:murein tripeptide amidase MpaA
MTSFGDGSLRQVRTPTTWDAASGVLSISVSTTDADTVWVAYFAPYSYEQHQALIAQCQGALDHDGSALCAVESIGQSLDGRDIDLITAGTGPTTCWVVARQHPGESMAEWWADGFLGRLLDKDDEIARSIRSIA